MNSESVQVRKNLIFNILSLISSVAVGIFYTPYLVRTLGIIAYGVIPLALIINQYISVLTGSLTSALTRFYSIALQKEQKEEASRYLNTSLIVVLGIIVLLLVPLWVLIQNIESVFTIPEDLVNETKQLFVYTILSFFCSLISSVFNITLYAYNRLDLMNIVKIIRTGGKLLFVIVLFTFLKEDLAYVGLANLLTESILLIYSIFIFYQFSIGRVELSLRYYSNSAFKAIGLLAFWVIIQQVGDTGLYRIDNVLVNMFWSSKESGILGAFTELGNYTMIIAGVVGSLFGPIILIAYSKEEHDKVQEISLDNALIVGVLVAVMIGVLIGFSPVILKLWLGEEFVAFNLWLHIKLALIPFYSAAGIFAFAARAWNKVRFPAIMTVLLGGVNFVILYFLAKVSEGNLSYVNYMLVVGFVLGVTQSYFLNGLYFAKLYPGNRIKVWVIFIKILMVLVYVYLLSFIVMNLIIEFQTIMSLSVICLVSAVLLVSSVYFSLNKKQLKSLVSLVKK
ncbi:oligosaccharide flippase family protein [Myroides odoratimimus]|uniref:oligosaccharide flippase family protein n=2 Tax=Myroides odoratimimus TaxID=76832 RepID=UPI003D2F7BAA